MSGEQKQNQVSVTPPKAYKAIPEGFSTWLQIYSLATKASNGTVPDAINIGEQQFETKEVMKNALDEMISFFPGEELIRQAINMMRQYDTAGKLQPVAIFLGGFITSLK